MNPIVLTADEFTILRDHKYSGPSTLMKARADAILMASEGLSNESVARLVDRSTSTIITWKREFCKIRLASIHDNNLGNRNASKLTEAQYQEVLEVLHEPPSAQGIPAPFWTVPHLSNWVSDRFEVTYASDTSLVFLLHQAGLSFHKTEAFDQRRGDEGQINERMEQIRSQIAQDLADPQVLLLAADEVRLEHEALTRRAWYRKGTKTKLHVDRKRHAQSYLGLLDQNTGAVHLERLDWQNSSTIIDALVRFTLHHPDKKITIVWDNAGWHRSKELRAALSDYTNLEKVHLINLPPYAPDRNPIEHVWNEAKNQIANLQRDTFDETRTAFEDFITTNTFPYRL